MKSLLVALVLCVSCSTVFGVAGCIDLICFRGDIDGSGAVIAGGSEVPSLDINISDPVMLSNYLFSNGPTPSSCAAIWDANSDSSVNISDVNFLLDYLFASGAAPAPDQIICHVEG